MLKEKERKKERNQSLPPTYQALWWGCPGRISFIFSRASQGKCLSIILQMRTLSSRSQHWPRRDRGSHWSASVICLESFAGSRPPVLGRRAQPVLLFTVSPSFFNLHECSLLAATVPLTWYFMSSGLQSLLHKNKQPHVCPPSVSPALDKKLRTN